MITPEAAWPSIHMVEVVRSCPELCRFCLASYLTLPFRTPSLERSLMPAVEGALREGSLDFYLGAAPWQKPAPGLAVQHLCDNTRVVVCRKGHPLARVRSLKSLAGAVWASTAIDHNAEEDLARLFASHGQAAPRVMMSAHSALSVQVAAEVPHLVGDNDELLDQSQAQVAALVRAVDRADGGDDTGEHGPARSSFRFGCADRR